MNKIHNCNLTDEERLWFLLLLSAPIRYKTVILNQIEKAVVRRDYSANHIFLDFIYPDETPRLPGLLSGVLLTMIVQHKNKLAPTEGQVVYQSSCDMPYFFGSRGECPTEFLLHFDNGVIDYLEVFNGDGSILDHPNLYFGRADFSISPKLAP